MSQEVNANLNADFLSRLPLPTTDQDRIAIIPMRLTDPDDVGLYLSRVLV